MLGRTTMVLVMALGVLTFTAWGCGSDVDRPELGRVSGKVTYKGSPVKNGTVTFFPLESKSADSGRPAIGEFGADGTFELTTFDTGDGATLGQHKAIVVARSEEVAEKVSDGMIPSQLPGDIKQRAGVKPPVPQKYTDPEATPLRYTVRPGANHFDIELKD